MSVLIKGISIPKYGELSITIDALGGVAYTDRDMKAHDVIEVPTPHGDLIDLSTIQNIQYYDADGEHNVCMEVLQCGYLRIDAPTIIEAEGKE